MALSGTFYNTVVSQGWQLRIDWSATQNVSANTSTVTANMYVYNRYQSYNQGNTAYYIIDGTKTFYKYSYGSTAGWNYLGQKVFTLTHNADGTKSYTLSGAWHSDISGSSYTPLDMSISGTITLNTIPRASSISAPASVTCGSSVTVTVTRASTSFTHTVQVLYGSTVKNTLVTKGTGNCTFTPALATYAPLNTTGSTVSCTIKCITYSGNTEIGNKSINITVNIPNNNDTKPTCSISSIAQDSSSSAVAIAWGVYVKGQSKAKITLSASGKQSATIKSYSITGGGYTGTTTPYVTGLLNTAGSNSFSATATDSRGFASAAATSSITVVDWNAPTISNVLCQRCTSNGTVDDSGKYCKITAETSFSTCDNHQGGSTSYPVKTKVYYRQYGTDSWTLGLDVNSVNGSISLIVGSGTTFDTEKAYDIRVDIVDSFKTSSYQDVLSTALYTMVLRHGGKGIAFGKASEMDALECAFPAYFSDGIFGKQNPTDAEFVDVLDKLSILSPLETSYPNMMYVSRTNSVSMPKTYWQIDLGNLGPSTMISMDLIWMSAYGWHKLLVGGYMYSTNNWHAPFAKKITNSTANVDFGHYADSVTHKWIGVTLGGGYGTFVAVTNIVLGYTQDLLNKNSIQITYNTTGYTGTKETTVAATW